MTSPSRWVALGLGGMAALAVAILRAHRADRRRVQMTDALQDAYRVGWRSGAMGKPYMQLHTEPPPDTDEQPATWATFAEARAANAETRRVRTAEEISRDRWSAWRSARGSMDEGSDRG